MDGYVLKYIHKRMMAYDSRKHESKPRYYLAMNSFKLIIYDNEKMVRVKN